MAKLLYNLAMIPHDNDIGNDIPSGFTRYNVNRSNSKLRGIAVTVFNSNPSPEVRISGGSWYALGNTGSNFTAFFNLNVSSYTVEYRDSVLAPIVLGTVQVQQETCFSPPSAGSGPRQVTFRVFESTVSVGTNVGGFVGQIGSSAFQGAGFSDSQVQSQLVSGRIPSATTKTGVCEISIFSGLLFKLPESLAATANATNETADNANDGTIFVNITNGSGFYLVTLNGSTDYLVNNGNPAQTLTILNLAPGNYTLDVFDDIVDQLLSFNLTIIEAAPEPAPEGDYLEVPALNSLHFVEEASPDNCTTFQTMDNVLFCKQEFLGFWHQNYFQKVAKCDPLPIQFLSNYSEHQIALRDYVTGAIVRTYAEQLKEENTNQVQTELIFLTNHNLPNQTRVYFNVGGLPVPVVIGNTFEIINNADGFNGNYAIINIANDILLGQQYLVINKPYLIASPSSNASAKFLISQQDFNVFEFVTNDLATLPNGQYYITIDGISSTPRTWTSEPIDLQVEHKGTNLIEYRNFDNAFDITYTTGITNRIRVESTFFKRIPNGEDTTYRNCDQSLVKLSAKRRRKFLLEIWQLPPYMHEKLSVVFGHDLVKINGVRHQTDEQYQEPKYITRFPLSNAQIIIEQYGWFDKYNSDDIGDVDGIETGFIIANGGFLKR